MSDKSFKPFKSITTKYGIVGPLMIVIGLFIIALSLAGCGPEKVSFNTLEDARGQARENAEFNAKRWRAQMYADWDIVSRGDSTQAPECPQGDGWATMDLISPDKKMKKTLKCSTVSGNVGCLEATDFKSKSYAGEEGSCQPTSKVPHPLPKIAK